VLLDTVTTISVLAGMEMMWRIANVSRCLALDAGRERLVTSEEWESSYAGAASRPARLATQPMLTPAGSELAGGETIGASIRKRWPMLLILAALTRQDVSYSKAGPSLKSVCD